MITVSLTAGPKFLEESETSCPVVIPWIVPADEIRSIHEFQSLHDRTMTNTNVNWSGIHFDLTNFVSCTGIEGDLMTWIRASQVERLGDELGSIARKGVV